MVDPGTVSSYTLTVSLNWVGNTLGALSTYLSGPSTISNLIFSLSITGWTIDCW